MQEISGSLVVREKKILMTFDEEKEVWNVPSVAREKGEISAEAAERATENLTGCSSETVRYKGKLKTYFDNDGIEFTWQPYRVEIDGKPEECTWVPLEDLESRELAAPLDSVREKLTKLN